MQNVLEDVGVTEFTMKMFLEERITPEVVHLMSRSDWDKVGLEGNGRIAMKIRQLCIKAGQQSIGSKYDIKREDIEGLLAARVNLKEIAQRLCVSYKTLRRRMVGFGLEKHTSVTTSDLEDAVQSVLSDHPNSGETMLQGHLASRNIIVPRVVLRTAVHSVDPHGAAARSSRRLRRRTYFSKGPNEIWHIDGNHKLIRWGIVVHGAVDGFSRFPTFIKASTNNKAKTVVALFTEAMVNHGVPVRVRADAGGENVLVQRLMEQLRGVPGSFIVGKSTHNQRIERLWRDVFIGVLCQFHQKFHQMEDLGILDPCNSIHLAALHSVFLPQINQRLMEWLEGWIHHKLRTVGRCPYELFKFGQECAHSELLCSLDVALQQLPLDCDAAGVATVLAISLSDEQRTLVDQAISDGHDTGEELYRAVLQIIE